MVGESGEGAIVGKYRLGRKTAIQGGMLLGADVTVQGEFLWHDFNLIKPKKGSLPLFFGMGGRLGRDEAAIRGPVGLSYLFEKAPLDLFLELVPTLVSGERRNPSEFRLEAGFGARYNL
jgi:hypothetical protein